MSYVDEPTAQLRPQSEIETARAAAAAWMSHASDPRFEQGAIAAYDWLLGRRGEAPVSGIVAAPTYRQVVDEEQVADDATYGRRGAPEVSHRFAVGAANALMWARGIEGIDPPVPLDYTAAG